MKYLRLRDELLDLVDGLDPGAPLPPERTLAAQLGVSRMTLRRAVDELVAGRSVIRRHGAGTFVATKLSQGLTATSFSQDMRARGMEPGAVTLDHEVVPAGASVGRRLHVSPSDPVLRVRRLRLADHAPMAIELLHVPQALVPGLSGAELSGRSFYATLRERYGLAVAGAEQALEATVTDAEESDDLQVPLHSPAFLFERTSWTQDRRVLEFVRSVYRGDRYRIVASIRPGSPQSGAPPTDDPEKVSQ